MDTRSASCRWSSLIASRDGFDFCLACGAGAVGVGALAGGAVGVLELADSSADVDEWSEPLPEAIARTIRTSPPPINPAIRTGSQLRQLIEWAPEFLRGGSPCLVSPGPPGDPSSSSAGGRLAARFLLAIRCDALRDAG